MFIRVHVLFVGDRYLLASNKQLSGSYVRTSVICFEDDELYR